MSLEKLIKTLENPKRSIDIFDKVTGEKLYPLVDLKYILARNNNPSDWFKSLFEEHQTEELMLQLKFSNGSSNIAKGFPIFIKPKPNTQSNPTLQPTQQQQTGLFGGGLAGLSSDQVQKVFDYDRINRLLTEADRKTKEWYDKYQVIKDMAQELKNKLYNYDDKKQIEIDRIGNEKKPLISEGTIEKITPILATLAEKLLSNNTTQPIPENSGLAGQNLSQTKQDFVKILAAENLTDNMTTMLYLVGKGLININGFESELNTLLYVHNLTSDPKDQPLRKAN